MLGNEAIVTSPDQKFYLPQEREWRAAKDIKRGDALSDAAEEYVVVLEVVPTNDALRVFELSLQEPHTFYVTKQNFLVHNCAPIVLGIAETVPVAVTAAKVGLAGLVSWFAKQVQKSNGRRSLGGSAAPQPRPPEDPEDEEYPKPKIFEKNAKHIFSKEPGHMPDTPQNRELLIDLVSDIKNFKGVDKYGSHWFSKILPDGKQVWAFVRDNMIRDGGVNEVPRVFNEITGLCRNIK